MPNDERAVLSKRISEVAESYRRRGYEVVIYPSPKLLPEFLSGYKPDIIAESPDESVVVEVKSGSKVRQSGYLSELARIIQKHPGWRLELILDNTDRQVPETLTRDQIKKRIQEGEVLAQDRMLTASLLLTWSATEAAMRLAGKEYEIELPDYRPTTVISRLYMDGVLSRKEYDFLLEGMRKRNSVAHGFQEKTVTADFIKKMGELAMRLLDAQHAKVS